MGGKQTKIADSYLPATPSDQRISSKRNINVEKNEILDPRSPSGSRTPMHASDNCVDTEIQLTSVEVPQRDSRPDNALDVLRKRFFKGFTYNLNDPRSPSLHLNRTPLIFEDTLEKSLNLDDTFTDLFVVSRQPEAMNPTKQQLELKSAANLDIEMPEENEKLDILVKDEEKPDQLPPSTPFVLQQEIDPRSPSIGVERTPIFIADYESDEANEDNMLENILSTLSLNLNSSGSSSVTSMSVKNPSANFQNSKDLEITNTKPLNKHLDRVRCARKLSNKGAHHRRPKRLTSRPQIYEDCENQITSTPTLKTTPVTKNDSRKCSRTPLSCVRNRNGNHARSRSVESSVKSIKTRLALTSFDDTLNLSDNKNVHNLLIMQQES